ncbi:hypothetical protein K435DRAFT_864592 [Dendrothele bispora CBS 962.96]|uniref:Uncharacterized protein n=1 Tax=Dendrothele bispora (strain CBS 962.96) TaxID=1314807 RepID=A0A4S8LMD5_DENBC|nr:hypothetical protein K435DRAFT_864592 [Dendrothele bispora CBS 962.96]
MNINDVHLLSAIYDEFHGIQVRYRHVLLRNEVQGRFSKLAASYSINGHDLCELLTTTGTAVYGFAAARFALPRDSYSNPYPPTLELIAPFGRVAPIINFLHRARPLNTVRKRPCLLINDVCDQVWNLYSDETDRDPVFRVFRLKNHTEDYCMTVYRFISASYCTLQMTLLTGTSWCTFYPNLFKQNMAYIRFDIHICDKPHSLASLCRALGFTTNTTNNNAVVPCLFCPTTNFDLHKNILTTTFHHGVPIAQQYDFTSLDPSIMKIRFSSTCFNRYCPTKRADIHLPNRFYRPRPRAAHFLPWYTTLQRLTTLSPYTTDFLYIHGAAVYVPYAGIPRLITVPFSICLPSWTTFHTWILCSTQRVWTTYSSTSADTTSTTIFVDKDQRWNSSSPINIDFILVKHDRHGLLHCTSSDVPNSWTDFTHIADRTISDIKYVGEPLASKYK